MPARVSLKAKSQLYLGTLVVRWYADQMHATLCLLTQSKSKAQLCGSVPK